MHELYSSTHPLKMYTTNDIHFLSLKILAPKSWLQFTILLRVRAPVRWPSCAPTVSCLGLVLVPEVSPSLPAQNHYLVGGGSTVLVALLCGKLSLPRGEWVFVLAPLQTHQLR